MNGIKPIVGVGAVVIRQDGSILLGYRIKAGESATWCLPGGHVEPGESFATAAIREIQEEAGIGALSDVSIFAIAQQLDKPITSVTGAVVAHITGADVEAKVLEPNVFSVWRWFDPDELPMPLFPASAAVLACWREDPPPEGWCSYAIASSKYLFGEGK